MKKLIYLLVASIVLVAVSCNQSKKQDGYIVEANIEGLKDATIIVQKFSKNSKPTKVKAKDGKFTLKGKVSEPSQLGLMIENGPGMYLTFYVENTKMKLVGNVKEFTKAKLTGSIVNDHHQRVQKQEHDFWDKLKKYENLMADKAKFEALDAAKKEEVTQFVKHFRAGFDAIKENFVKKNPSAYYAAHLSLRLAGGRDKKGIMELVNSLDPKLKDTTPYKNLLKMAKESSKEEYKISEIFKVADIAYKTDPTFKGKELKGVKYLSIYSNGNVCALTNKNEILEISKTGDLVSKTLLNDIKVKLSSIAINKKDELFAFGPIYKEVESKYRGKVYKRKVIAGINCFKLNKKGNILSKVELKGAKSANGARILDGKALIADYTGGNIGIYSLKDGANMKKVKGMRQCCGILDFSLDKNNNIIVANLGKFRIESFNLEGKMNYSFGRRGRKQEDFHGCCNPVSVAPLSNGAIVSVEKDPTRIKIYSKNGVKVIGGISEMVKGCNYIPMIVDKNDNLYLASPDKGMIKCVSK